MKKIIAVLLLAVLTLSLCACSSTPASRRFSGTWVDSTLDTIISFNNNGTGTLKIAEDTYSFKWAMDKHELTDKDTGIMNFILKTIGMDKSKKEVCYLYDLVLQVPAEVPTETIEVLTEETEPTETTEATEAIETTAATEAATEATGETVTGEEVPDAPVATAPVIPEETVIVVDEDFVPVLTCNISMIEGKLCVMIMDANLLDDFTLSCVLYQIK